MFELLQKWDIIYPCFRPLGGARCASHSMDKFSSKAAANPLPATNAAAGSPERDAQSPPAQSETHPPESAAAPPSNEVFDLPPSEFGDDLTTRYFITRVDRLDDGAWRLNVTIEISVEEIAQGCGFDSNEFTALTSDQRERAAAFLLDGYGPDAAIKAAENFPTLKLVE